MTFQLRPRVQNDFSTESHGRKIPGKKNGVCRDCVAEENSFCLRNCKISVVEGPVVPQKGG